MKTLLVDDHALVREGMALVIARRFPPLELLEAGSVNEAMHQPDAHQDTRLPLLDLALPDSAGTLGLSRLPAHAPQLTVVVVSADESAETALAAIDAGAYLPQRRVSAPPEPGTTDLTPRPLAVLRLLVEGRSNKHIARRRLTNPPGGWCPVSPGHRVRLISSSGRTAAAPCGPAAGVSAWCTEAPSPARLASWGSISGTPALPAVIGSVDADGAEVERVEIGVAGLCQPAGQVVVGEYVFRGQVQQVTVARGAGASQRGRIWSKGAIGWWTSTWRTFSTGSTTSGRWRDWQCGWTTNGCCAGWARCSRRGW